MNKTKLTLLNKHISSSNDGVILISMSIGIFLIISIFTFFSDETWGKRTQYVNAIYGCTFF